MERTQHPGNEPTPKRPLTGNSIIDEPATLERCAQDYATCAPLREQLAQRQAAGRTS